MNAEYESKIRSQLDSAAPSGASRRERCEAIVARAVLLSAGLGSLPFVSIWTCIVLNCVMVSLLGREHGVRLNAAESWKIVVRIFLSGGVSYAMLTFGLKFFSEFLKGAGLFTFGGTTVAGMALDAALAGFVTYGVGYTASQYYEKEQRMSDAELGAAFRRYVERAKRNPPAHRTAS